jgi:hypothetical protein
MTNSCAPVFALIGMEPLQHLPVAPLERTAAHSGKGGLLLSFAKAQPPFGQPAPVTVISMPLKSLPSGLRASTTAASVRVQLPLMYWK